MLFFSLGFTVYEVLELEDLLLLVFFSFVFAYVGLFVKFPESTFILEILFVVFVELDLFESTVVVLLVVLLFVILLLVFLLAFVLLFVALLFVFLLTLVSLFVVMFLLELMLFLLVVVVLL